MTMFRVLVCGGRDYIDRQRAFQELDAVLAEHPILTIIHGACCFPNAPKDLRGADQWAQEWAQTRQMPYTGVPAQWRRHSKPAGPIRNAIMLAFGPQLVVAFPGGRGTKNMVDLAHEAGIEVREISETET